MVRSAGQPWELFSWDLTSISRSRKIASRKIKKRQKKMRAAFATLALFTLFTCTAAQSEWWYEAGELCVPSCPVTRRDGVWLVCSARGPYLKPTHGFSVRLSLVHDVPQVDKIRVFAENSFLFFVARGTTEQPKKFPILVKRLNTSLNFFVVLHTSTAPCIRCTSSTDRRQAH